MEQFARSRIMRLQARLSQKTPRPETSSNRLRHILKSDKRAEKVKKEAPGRRLNRTGLQNFQAQSRPSRPCRPFSQAKCFWSEYKRPPVREKAPTESWP